MQNGSKRVEGGIIQHFQSVAERALSKWGYPSDSQLKLLNFTENATFLVKKEGLQTMIKYVDRFTQRKD